MTKKQVNVGVPMPLLRKADILVKKGEFNSRASVVAYALRKYLEEREKTVGIFEDKDTE